MSRPGRPLGSKHSPEAKEKIRQAMVRRWQDPEYRARHLPLLLAEQPAASKLGNAVLAARPRVRPPAGTPARHLFDKVARVLGSSAARSIL